MPDCFARADQLHPRGAHVVHITTGGKNIKRFCQLTYMNWLARCIGDLHHLILVDLRVGRARRLHGQKQQGRRVIGFGGKGRGSLKRTINQGSEAVAQVLGGAWVCARGALYFCAKIFV